MESISADLVFFQEWMIGQLEPGRSLRECLYYLVRSILETLTFDFCLFHSGMMGRDSVSCDQQLEDQQWVVESRRFQSMSYHVQNKFQSILLFGILSKTSKYNLQEQNKKGYSRYICRFVNTVNKCKRVIWQI